MSYPITTQAPPAPGRPQSRSGSAGASARPLLHYYECCLKCYIWLDYHINDSKRPSKPLLLTSSLDNAPLPLSSDGYPAAPAVQNWPFYTTIIRFGLDVDMCNAISIYV